MMKTSDFTIGQEFWTDGGHWRCTDIGTRTIIAIKLDQKDPRNYNGPPYSIAEHVMDEYDLVTCYPTKALRDEQFEDVNDGPVG
jgi:hypothetical protein